MNIVFLAAGKSSRIYSKIKKNKCLIELNKKSIISKIIDASKDANIKNIHAVVGFNKNKLKSEILKIDNKIKFIYNKHFFDREMTYSMICALKKIKGDTIISYSDIIYNSSILKKLTKKNIRILLFHFIPTGKKYGNKEIKIFMMMQRWLNVIKIKFYQLVKKLEVRNQSINIWVSFLSQKY